MEILNIISNICSIISLVVAIFVASKVVQVEKRLDINGSRNIVGGRDVSVNQKD